MANKKFVKLLKNAKQHLAHSYSGGGSRYICFAINNAEGVRYEGETLKRVINDRLGDNSTIEYWLLKNKHVTREQLRSKKTKDKIQAYRHAWVDELIKEFS